ncbi:hypothetical protein PG985_015065 [Apiospora marii]|uniref:uncharacterized protein n=1 Tax=Apiospora marii TaxID=335849 RepID=UPI0031308401
MPVEGRENPVEPTISDDRTRGSLFEQRGDKWVALGPRERPTFTAPEPSQEYGLCNFPGPFTGDNVLQDFDFDAFLHDNDGGFDPSTVLEHDSDAARGPPGNAADPGPKDSNMAAKQMQLAQLEQERLLNQHNERRKIMAALENRKTDTTSATNSSSPCHGAVRAKAQDTPPGPSRGPPGLDMQSVANCLGIPAGAASSLEDMQAYISDLQRLRLSISGPQKLQTAPPPAPRRLDIHRVVDENGSSPRLYLDRPHWNEGDGWVLMGNLPISNVRAYLAKYPEVCFIRCRHYVHSKTVDALDRDATGNVLVAHESESVIPVEQSLASAIWKFNAFLDPNNKASTLPKLQIVPDFSNDWLNHDENPFLLYSPYRAFYHVKGESMDRFTRNLNGLERALFRRASDYILDECKAQFAEIDALVSKGKITNAYLPFVFKPGICVVQGKGPEARGYMCSSWLFENPSTPELASKATKAWGMEYAIAALDENPRPRQGTVKNYKFSAWYWELDPTFVKKEVMLYLDDIAIDDRSEKAISDMDIRPLGHVDRETSQRLKNRGEWFWKCRKPQMIAYREDTDKPIDHIAAQRYMIDVAVYHELHPTAAVLRHGKVETKSDIGTEAMEHPDPPDTTFVYLAPPSMRGFNLKTKKWCDLSLDGFAEVAWNTDAFANLVLDIKTKRLIQALISNQIEAELSTDIISGKGNGLIMLLHGGPGTGKTLTAESVAEIAQRPLYPVTCGDIGTEPGAVEKYLESVLSLGKAWGCVVLLDEADVFLEQRSLEDLHRNALVSVFLRVLEYYDGILVLTSNRVGTFDEAFKSRIQLAVHYASLTGHQRVEIWGNFLARLKRLDEEGIDFPDLERHVGDLARHRMNGREIRNVITTARQFARWERKQGGGAGVFAQL